MKGGLLKENNKWIVEHWEGLKLTEYFLCPYDAINLNNDYIGKNVEFKIIDEFTNPELYEGIPIFEGEKMAKIIKFY